MANEDKANSALPRKILVVDDDQEILNRVKSWLANYNINVMVANQWESAMYQFNQNAFDLCIVEQELSEVSGTVLIQKWLNHDIKVKRDTIFLVSVSNNRDKADEALIKELSGNISTITKPFSLPILLSAMSLAMEKKRKNQAIDEIKEKVLDPLVAQKKFTEAIHLSETKLAPTGARGKIITSQVYDAAGQLQNALKIVESLYAADSSNMLYLNEIARIQMLLGNLDAAQKAYEKADEVAPKNLKRLENMAELYLSQHQPQKSVDKYKQLMALSPENKDLKYGFYERLVQCGFEDVARDFCNQTSTPNELIKYYNNKGVLHSKEGNYAKAITEYTNACHLIPGAKDLYRILYNLAIAHINLKQPEHLREAYGFLEQALKLRPDFTKAREKLDMLAKYLKAG
jgi:tetratricopeptide (TPR) repeat protein